MHWTAPPLTASSQLRSAGPLQSGAGSAATELEQSAMADGFIYFARVKSRRHGHLFKIGFSNNPLWRVKCLYPADNPAQMIDYFSGTMDEELALHALLDAYRISGEWYRAGKRIHRIMLYCTEHRAVPPSVSALAERKFAAKMAKREMSQAHRDASAFLSDDRNFGITRDNDPFLTNRVAVNRDLSWLDAIMRGLARLTTEGDT
jgi:hypothetical protein